MSTKPAKVESAQDPSLLKCVIKVVFGDSPPSIPWQLVASYMPGDPKPDTLRKRFDKTKRELAAMGPGGTGMEAGGDVDFFKCILKFLLVGKPTISWPQVASFMPDGPKPDTLRKRFDKVKKEIAAIDSGEAREAQPAAASAEEKKVKKAPTKTGKIKAAEDGKAAKPQPNTTIKRALTNHVEAEPGEDGEPGVVKVAKKPRKIRSRPIEAEIENED